MLIVKWITHANGFETERLFQASNVEIKYPHTTNGEVSTDAKGNFFKHHDYELHGPSLFIDAGPGGAGFMLTEGKCYVMNDQGRTVGSYTLSDDRGRENANGPK